MKKKHVQAVLSAVVHAEFMSKLAREGTSAQDFFAAAVKKYLARRFIPRR